MNSGSFFRLDLENSKVFEGVTYYEYIDLPDLAAGKDNIRYPIRMSISQDRVSFFVHYFDDSGHYLLRHTEEVILDLPFSTTNTEALSSIIKRIYNTVFPMSDFLLKVMERRYDSKKEVELNQRKKGKLQKSEYADIEREIEIVERYKYLKKSQINKDSYSSLYIWGLIENLDSDISSYQLQNSKKKFSKFLRKLLLDFMFDLMHSDVFESSKYYSQMREGLMNDFFFSSIVKKSEFYYCRSLIRSRYNEAQTNEEQTNEKSIYGFIKELYAEKLDDAESAWVDAIMSPMADKHFPFSPEWFEEPVNRKKKKGRFNVSDSWFVDPEEEMQRVVFSLNDDEGKMHFLNSFELSNLIGSKDQTSVLSRNTTISKWFYHRFDFRDSFRLHLYNGSHLYFFFILSIFAFVLIGSLLFPTSNIFWESPKCFFIFPSIAVAVFIIEIVHSSYMIFRKRNSVKLDDKLVRQRLWREFMRTSKLMFYFTCFASFLLFYDYYNYNQSLLMTVGAISLLIVACFTRIKRLINNIHLLLPRLVASTTAAWIMLVIGNDIFEEFLSLPICIIIAIIVFVFILYENNKTLPNLETKWKFRRALELMLISYSMSLIVGFFALDILKKTKPEIIECACQEQSSPSSFTWFLFENSDSFSLTVFPEYLIPFSFLAMFIGVFIQMIFEEKNITEM